MDIPRRPHFIHHNQSVFTESLSEIVFGAEDGMVSTLGTLTGIAAATQSGNMVILAGLVIVCVESVSMGVGSYLSNTSAKRVQERMLEEERAELKELPAEEERELVEMYERDGWPKQLAVTMAHTASKDEELFLKEMAYRELKIAPDDLGNPMRDGIFMFSSYVAGGMVPVAPYFFLPVAYALPVSAVITLLGLFALGVATTKFTKQSWLKSGFEMLSLASIAAGIGFVVGKLLDSFLATTK